MSAVGSCGLITCLELALESGARPSLRRGGGRSEIMWWRP